MFAFMKPRDVDPLQFDKKVAFWSQCIARYCEASKSCVIDYTVLREKFCRGDLIPTPLENVMIQMSRKRDLQTEDDMLRKSQGGGWMSGSLSFVTGSGIPDVSTQRLFHCPTIAKLAAQLRDYNKETAEEFDDIISFNELKNKTLFTIRDDLSFELAVKHLVNSGDVLEGKSNNGARILKFKDQKSESPLIITAADASEHDFRSDIRNTLNEIRRLEDKEKQLEEHAKQALADKNHTEAKYIILKKRLNKKVLEKKKEHYPQLFNMHVMISVAHLNSEILNAYRRGNQTYKNALGLEGLSADSIDETIRSIQETMDDFKKINEAIRGFIPAEQRIDDEELEDELNEMMEADKLADRNNSVRVNENVINISLPKVPSSGLPFTSNPRIRATKLRFQCINRETVVAQVAVLLNNISKWPLYYKFETGKIFAHPFPFDFIAASRQHRVVLTWKKPKSTEPWEDIASPKRLLITGFADRDTTSTRLIAFMDPSSTCPSDNPPTEQLMLDALSKSTGNDLEITVTKSSDNDSASQQLESP